MNSLLDFLVRNPDSPVRHTMPIEVISALSLRWFDRSPSLLYALAEHVFRAGEPARAAQLLEHLLHLGRTQTYDRSRPFCPGFVGDDAMMNLAACYRRLGRAADAESCYRQLLSSPRFAQQAGEELARMRHRPLP